MSDETQKKPQIIGIVAFWLVILGGLNWGLVGLTDLNVFVAVSSNIGLGILEQIIYVLCGAAGIYLIVEYFLWRNTRTAEDGAQYTIIDHITFWLVISGALSWGAIGAADKNVVVAISNIIGLGFFEQVTYILVGVASIYMAVKFFTAKGKV